MVDVNGETVKCIGVDVLADPDENAPDRAPSEDPSDPNWDLYDVITRLKDTVRRLNRRCQEYESALTKKIAEHPGRSFGRSLANAAATMYRVQLEAARDEIERFRGIAEDANRGMRVMNKQLKLRAEQNERLESDNAALRKEVLLLRAHVISLQSDVVAYATGYGVGFRAGQAAPVESDE